MWKIPKVSTNFDCDFDPILTNKDLKKNYLNVSQLGKQNLSIIVDTEEILMLVRLLVMAPIFFTGLFIFERKKDKSNVQFFLVTFANIPINT